MMLIVHIILAVRNMFSSYTYLANTPHHGLANRRVTTSGSVDRDWRAQPLRNGAGEQGSPGP